MKSAIKIFVIILALSFLVACHKDPKAVRDKYYASGQKYLDNKKYEEARIEFLSALRVDKGHVPSILGIAKAFQHMGDAQNAIAAYQQVVRLDGKNVEARIQLGQYLLAGGMSTPELFKRAQTMAEEILKIDPANVEGHILLGNAYAGQNDVDKSLAELDKALSADPGNLKAMLNLGTAQLRKGDTTQAEATFKEALQKHPDTTQPYLALATFYLATKRPPEAEANFKKAFDLAPADPQCLYALVGFYMSAKRQDDAEKVFKEAIARKPKERLPWWGLADFYLGLGQTDKGMAALQDVLKVNKNDRQAELRLAEVYLHQNNDAKAQESVNAVLAENKNDAEAHCLQGRLLIKRGDSDKALAEFEAAIKVSPAYELPYLEKANLLLNRGDLENAQATLETVLQGNRNDLLARGFLARVLALRRRTQDALQQAEEVLTAMPANEDALVARGDAMRLEGKPAEAKRDYLKLTELKPQNALYWHQLGALEASQGDESAGLAHLRKAVELNPGLTVAINDILYLFTKSKKYDAALAELDRLAKTSAPQDEIHRFRGQVYSAKGDRASAEAEFRKTIELNPRNYQTYVLLGDLSMRSNNVAQAIKEVDQLIAKNPKLSAAYLLKGYYLQVEKDIPGAMTNYRKSLDLDSGNPLAANNLAWLLCENTTNFEEALSLAKAAKKQAPDAPEIADTLGWVYYKMKNYTLAVDQLLFSVNNRKQPTAENYYHLGMAYYAQGNLGLAKQTLKRALELSQSFSGADDARKIMKLRG
ncbi:MAG: tetratricopeptide repeat protein [Acidobacteriota bacterium]|jgi:tetratricopeptide (TPR) repeat protein